ncbi:MAG: hypothetical protein AAAFM81_03715 [Pseudomonadota bacterium]
MKQLIPILVLLLMGCSSDSPEDQIVALVDDMARAAEDEKMSPLRGAIADDYRDLRDNDRQAVLNIMRGVMLRTDNILIFPNVTSIRWATDDYAEVDVSVRFAGADWERLSLSGSVYDFELEVRQAGGDWQIVTARWAEEGGEPR